MPTKSRAQSQKVLAWMAARNVSTIHTGQIGAALGVRASDAGAARALAARMVARGELRRVAPGIYALSAQRDAANDLLTRMDTSFGAAGHAVSHISAMLLHGYDKHPPSPVLVLSLIGSHSQGANLGVPVKVLKDPVGGLGRTMLMRDPTHGLVRATSFARTAIDALERPRLCGGHVHAVAFLAHALQALGPAPLVAEALALDGSRGPSRLGFLLELAGVDAPHLEPLRARLVPGYTNLVPDSDRSGTHVRRWGIRVNVPLAPIATLLRAPPTR